MQEPTCTNPEPTQPDTIDTEIELDSLSIVMGTGGVYLVMGITQQQFDSLQKILQRIGPATIQQLARSHEEVDEFHQALLNLDQSLETVVTNGELAFPQPLLREQAQ